MGVARWSVERTLLVMTFLFSVLAFTFGVGVNWARLTAQESAIDVLQKTTVLREVSQRDHTHLSEAIDRLPRALEQPTIRRTP